MGNFKEFEGKNIDEAISEACKHFSTERKNLEIEIGSIGSTGIFGLMGAKKAKIKAKLRSGTPGKQPSRPDTNKKTQEPKPEAAQTQESKPEAPEKHEPKPDTRETQKPISADPELENLVTEVVRNIITPITGNSNLVVKAAPERVEVVVDDKENSGLIIGREGQTLAAIQYLANRIVSKQYKHPVRVQIDTDGYRDKQNESIRQMALHLADKAKHLGRPQSTRPLSSYHRRVVHLALQSMDGIFTRSKGDGPMKRVLILPKRDRGKSQNRNNYR